MNTPTDEARERAEEILNRIAVRCTHWETKRFEEQQEIITLAILEAEKRGAEREREECAIAAETPTDFGPSTTDPTRAYLIGRSEAVKAIRARGTARSEKRSSHE